MSVVASLIRQAREEAGLSQRALARAAGTSGPTISAYETANKRPRADVIDRLIDATGNELVLRPRRSKADKLARLLHSRIAEAVQENPALIGEALNALRHGRARSDYRDQWERILIAGPAAVVGVLTSDDESLQPLRATNPFSVLEVVDPQERADLVSRAYAQT